MKIINIFLIATLSCSAAITNLVATPTNAQILLTYTAPNTDPCTIEVSEEADYTPLVHDINPALFTDADDDVARFPSFNTSTTSRTFVVGIHGRYVRTSDTMSVLSRALAAVKLHYIRVTCGADTATTTATTVSFPFNSTYVPPIQLSDVDQDKSMTPTWPYTRNARIIDPWSGTELFRSALPVEADAGIGPGSGGNVAVCSEKQHDDGWWLCRGATGNLPQSISLYAIRTAGDGSMDTRYLGYSPSGSTPVGAGYCAEARIGFDPTTFGRWYCQLTGGIDVIQYTYTGDFSDKTASAPYDITPDTTITTLFSDVQSTFNTWADSHAAEWGGTTYDESNFNCVFNGIVQADKNGGGSLLQVLCRETQDAPGWLSTFKIGVGLIGGYPGWWGRPETDGCGHHSNEEIGQQGGLYSWTAHRISTFPPVTTLNGAIDNSQTTMVLAGQTLRGSGKPEISDLIVGSVLYAQDTAELIRITSIASFPTVSIERGVDGTTPTAHADGITLQRECLGNGSLISGTGQNLWWPQDDPYGADTQSKFVGAHEGIRPGIAIDGALYAHYTGYLTESVYDDYSIFNVNPTFSGYKTPGFCCAYETYPVPWFTQGVDFLTQHISIDSRMPFYTSNTYAAVGGTSQIYKVSLSRQTDIGFSNTLGWRYVPVFAMGPYVAMDGESKMLRNISGPGSVLGDTSSDFQFCIVLIPDECVTGSVENEVYVSSPSVTGSSCDSGAYGTDICVSERTLGTIGPSEYNTTPVQENNQNIRTLLMPNTFTTFPVDQSGSSYIKGLPDGSAFYMQDAHGSFATSYMVLAKRQPTDASAIDSLDRTVFLNQPCTYTGSIPMGATRMLCEFGYSLDDDQEWKANTSRDEETFAVKATIDATFPTKPYLFQSEIDADSTAGIDVTGDCIGTCTVAIPDTPVRRVGYYRIVFRDTDGDVLQTGTPVAFIGGGDVQGSPANFPAFSGTPRISGAPRINP